MGVIHDLQVKNLKNFYIVSLPDLGPLALLLSDTTSQKSSKSSHKQSLGMDPYLSHQASAGVESARSSSAVCRWKVGLSP